MTFTHCKNKYINDYIFYNNISDGFMILEWLMHANLLSRGFPYCVKGFEEAKQKKNIEIYSNDIKLWKQLIENASVIMKKELKFSREFEKYFCEFEKKFNNLKKFLSNFIENIITLEEFGKNLEENELSTLKKIFQVKFNFIIEFIDISL